MNREREIWYEPHPVSPARKAEILAQGYRIIDAKYRQEKAEQRGNTAPPPEEQTQTTLPDPHKLGTAALKAELAARGIDLPEGAKKADLVALLEAALAAEGGRR